ncbi:MAG TPA: APC family permease [Terriglobales bacterium]
MIQLARKLRLIDYFTLGWGTMIGAGWLVVMDDWLSRGGSLGAVMGFVVGGLLLLPVGYVYGRLVATIPDAAGEVAYTARVFSPRISYFTGWMMVLAYFIVCPWEAVAVGKIAAYIFPQLDSFELYQFAGHPIFLPRLIVGLALTALLTFFNYRGIRLTATFQNWTAFATMALFLCFVAVGASKGSAANFPPLFTHSPWISILLTMQIVPYFMTGFESVVKGSEEAQSSLGTRGFFRAIVAAILAGVLFYAVIIATVSYVAPWKDLLGKPFMTAVAFERAAGSRLIVRVILVAALLSLVKCFNGNFVAASRLIFAMGRRGLIYPQLGRIHPTNQTPFLAVISIGVATAICMFLGDFILVPISEVGSVAAAAGWFATCAAYFRMKPSRTDRRIAAFGSLVGLSMILIKIVPGIPGHFTGYEWLALAVWIVLGALLAQRSA